MDFIDPLGLQTQHPKGSAKWCEQRRDDLASKRNLIREKIEDMNSNGSYPRGPLQGRPRKPLPYDDPNCARPGHDTVKGHINTLEGLYDSYKSQIAEYYQYCGSPPPWAFGAMPALRPRFAKGDKSVPPTLNLPTPWWNRNGPNLIPPMETAPAAKSSNGINDIPWWIMIPAAPIVIPAAGLGIAS